MASKGLGEGGPALAELTGGEDEDAVAGRGEVGDGGLHGAGAGAGEDDDVVGGTDELLELGEDTGVEGAELCGAVMDVSRGHGELSGGEQGGGARREETCLTDHGFYSNESRSPHYTLWGVHGNTMAFVTCSPGACAGETQSMTNSRTWMILYWLWVAVEIYVVFTARIRRGGSTGVTTSDRGSLLLLWCVIGGSISAGFWIAFAYAPTAIHAGHWLCVTSDLVFAVGLAIRITAIYTLAGRSFTANVSIHATQTLHRSGLFRYVRHPSYTGMMLIFLGLGLRMQELAVAGDRGDTAVCGAALSHSCGGGRAERSFRRVCRL